MAKYTELFADYLERGGSLPASFSLIEGFEEIFKKHYCDKEIGFETEALFFMKLDYIADVVIPLYASKISKLASAWLEFDAPVKWKYTKDDRTFTGGKQHAETTELPFDSTTAEPSMLNDTDEYTNEDANERNEREGGATFDEAIKRIEFLNSKVYSLILECLKEFKGCFMGVY